MKPHIILGAVVVVLALVALALVFTQAPRPQAQDEIDHKQEAEAAAQAEAEETTMASQYSPQLPPESGPRTRVRFNTSMGSFEIALFDDLVPVTVQNFLTLVKKDFYKNTIFHRVIKGFMLQGGCPEGSGMGGPGYTIADEFHPSLKHEVGTLSMANKGQPRTGGSQFFITVAKTAHLDNKHSVFGRVVSGMDVVFAISKTATDTGDRPLTPVVLQSIDIVSEKPAS